MHNRLRSIALKVNAVGLCTLVLSACGCGTSDNEPPAPKPDTNTHAASFDSLFRLGAEAWDAGDLKGAIDYWNEAEQLKGEVQEEEKLWTLFSIRAGAYLKLGENQAAIDDYTTAFEYKSFEATDRSTALAERGLAWGRSGEPAKALADYDAAIAIEPNYVNALVRSAWIRATCEDVDLLDADLALKHAKAACESDEWTSDAAISTLAAACAATGNFKLAIEFQDRAIELNPDDAELLEMRRAFEDERRWVQQSD